jgi:hypothetical protein
MIVLRLDETIEHQGRFKQKWTIIDDKHQHHVVSDSEWGDMNIVSGGKRIFNVEETQICAGQIVASAISVVSNPTEDGESVIIDDAWVNEIIKNGVSRDSLLIDPSDETS